MWDKIDEQEQFYDEFMEKIDKREEYKEYESPLEDPNPNVGFGIKWYQIAPLRIACGCPLKSLRYDSKALISLKSWV